MQFTVGPSQTLVHLIQNLVMIVLLPLLLILLAAETTSVQLKMTMGLTLSLLL